ncbi:MAG: acyl-CoA dehydrogenase [Gammaproteobacteria bacterium]|nr:acyl-CoA dehydrogenase [Gammaproteobacteria bacterium]
MIDFEIPDEIRMVRDTVARFVEEQLIPLEQEVEFIEENIPADTWRGLRTQLRELGLLNLARPVSEGGAGFGQRDMAVVHEAQARSLFGGDLWRDSGVPEMLQRFPAAQLDKFAAKAERDELYSCFCLTDPTSGSDPSSMRTSFVRDGDRYILNGRKIFISGAHKADYAIVYAREAGTSGREGINTFLVDTAEPGFTAQVIPTMGRPSSVSSDACEVLLEDCMTPESCRLTDAGSGWGQAQNTLGGIRFAMGARSVALASRCLEMALDYSKQRSTFGELISNRQSVQNMLADSYTEINATRLLTYYGAWKQDQGRDARQEISMVKIMATEMLGKVADRAIQIHGGMGLTKALPLEHIYRNARVDRIVDGPNEVHRWVIARNLLRDGIPPVN